MPDGCVIVTGAASGIGAATVAALRGRGLSVVELDVQPGRSVLSFDVADEAHWRDLTLPSRLVGLVNAAGIRRRAAVVNTEVSDFDDVLAVNCRGAFLGMREAARRWSDVPAVGRRSIVNVASATTARPVEHQIAYQASKAAVEAMTQAAAAELAPLGVRVNAVAPGSIHTPMTANGWDDAAHATRMRGEIPLGRAGAPEEVAGVIAYLLLDAPDYLSGGVVAIDGAWTCR